VGLSLKLPVKPLIAALKFTIGTREVKLMNLSSTNLPSTSRITEIEREIAGLPVVEQRVLLDRLTHSLNSCTEFRHGNITQVLDELQDGDRYAAMLAVRQGKIVTHQDD
jgi:hypothetical protein